MSKKRKQYDDDDGRTIVNMDVPGTSWYQDNDPKRLQADSSDSKRRKSFMTKVDLTRAELRQITWSALLAGLTIAAVYAVAWILLTLFATQIWLK